MDRITNFVKILNLVKNQIQNESNGCIWSLGEAMNRFHSFMVPSIIYIPKSSQPKIILFDTCS